MRGGGEGRELAQRSRGRRAGNGADVRTDPRPWAVIHGEKRGLSSCLPALPLSARWIEV